MAMILVFAPPIGTAGRDATDLVFARIFNGSALNTRQTLIKNAPPLPAYKPSKPDRVFVDKPIESDSTDSVTRHRKDGRLIDLHPITEDGGYWLKCDGCRNYALFNVHWVDIEDSREFDRFRACAKHAQRWMP
jgi:hypothetical protein